MKIKRGDIFYADLSPVVGSEQDGIRPVVIIQNDVGNKFSPTIIGVAITSKEKSKMPTHIQIDGTRYGLEKESVILAEQIRTLDKKRLKSRVGKLDNKTMDQLKNAIEISFGLRSDMDFDEYIKLYLQRMLEINKTKQKSYKNIVNKQKKW